MFSLIADSISDCIRMGIYKGAELVFSLEKKGMALENFFGCLDEVCKGAKLELADIGEFIFCEGTGSVLGIRSASVSFFSIAYLNNAKVYTFRLFDIARYLCIKNKDLPCQIICDSKKGFYNLLDATESLDNSPRELSYEDFALIQNSKVFYIKQREKQSVKEGFKELSYSIEDIADAINSNRDFYLNEEPEVKDALLLTKREFVKWNSQADT